MASNATNQAETNTSGPSLNILNIYSKDVSFEAPNAPNIFTLKWDPKVDFDLAINSQKIADNIWETVLDVTVTVSTLVEEDKRQEYEGKESLAAFLVEVKQAGIFSITGYEQAMIDKILATTVPAVLFPYLRETVASLVAKGGFPQLLLPPMNFDAMYQKHLDDSNKTSPIKIN